MYSPIPPLLLFIFLLITSTSALSASQTAPDPTCTRGLLQSGACCPPECGTCGGPDCDLRGTQLFSDCCPNSILSVTRVCDSVGPPCRLTPTFIRQSSRTSDPTCSRGIKAGNVCCMSRCGTCGGVGCGMRTKKANTLCCINQIRSRKRSCNVSTAPCRITGGRGGGRGGMNGSKGCAGKGALRGSWSLAPVRSGSLLKRHEACAVMVNGLVVLLGGRGKNKPVSVYNPKTKVWTTKSSAGGSVELHHMQCVAFRGKVYIPASWKNAFPFEDNNEFVYIYDVAKDSWSTKAGLPSARRRGGAASILRKGLIYVVGGNRGGHGAHATTLGWMDAYDIAKDRWITNLPSMPDGRDHTGGSLVKGQLCVAGGRDGGTRRFFNANKESTWCFNFGSRKWVKQADFPTPRAGSSYGLTCDGRLMVAGGEGDGRAYPNVDLFDGCSWKSGPPLVSARHGSGVAVSNCKCGQLFIPSGSGSQGGSPELTSTERFVPSGKGNNCAKF